MHKTIIFFLLLVILGCTSGDLDSVKNELEELKKNLGDIQYMAMDPFVSFSIKDVEFLPANNSYGSPSVKYRLNLKQNNKDFPLSNYTIRIVVSILNETDTEVNTFSVVSNVENGVLSLAEEEILYSFKKTNFDGLKLAIKNYSWNPIIDFQEYNGG